MSNLPVKMGNIEPYPFQRNLITEIIDHVRPAVKRQEVLPPAFLEAYVSAGKTIVIGGLVHYAAKLNLKILVLARTAELVSQNNEEIWNMDSQSCMLCGSLGFRQFSQNVIVASEKTASGALHSGKRSNFEDSNWVPHIILIDECFHPDTLITTKNGKFKISDPSLINEEILCVSESTGDVFYHKPLRVFSNGVKSISRIKTDIGEMKCTSTHKIYSEGSWVEAKNLRIGQKITCEDLQSSAIKRLLRASAAVAKKLFQVLAGSQS